MNKQEFTTKILNNMVYDENIRSGIYKCKDDTYQDLMHHAHGDMLPDDFRYKMIHDSLIILADDEDDSYDLMEELDSHIPVYTHDLMRWLSSSNSRYSYVDDAIEELGKGDSIIDDIMRGYYQELSEVFYLVEQWIDDNFDDDDQEGDQS